MAFPTFSLAIFLLVLSAAQTNGSKLPKSQKLPSEEEKASILQQPEKFDAFCIDSSTTAITGVLTTPGYPGNYGTDFDCYFNIYTPFGYSIQITIDYFSTEANNDFLQIDSSIMNSSWVNVDILSGINGFVNWNYTLENNARLRFHSDGANVAGGVHLTWNLNFEADSICTDYHSYFQVGQLSSQNYPANYSNNLSCEYFVYTPIGYNIVITFDYFSTEDASDYLQISTSNDSITFTNVTTLSGSMGGVHWNYTLQNIASFSFTTDGTNTARGFNLNWKANQNFPITLPESTNCQGPDILFLLDRSQAIYQDFYNNDIKTFLRNITSRYAFADDKTVKILYSTRFGVIEFSDTAHYSVPLADYSRYDFLSQVSQNVNYTNGGVSNVAGDLNLAYNILSQNENAYNNTPMAIVLVVNDIAKISFDESKAAMDKLKQIVQLPMGIIVPGVNGLQDGSDKRLDDLIGNAEYTFDSLQHSVSGIPYLTEIEFPCSICSGLIFIGEMTAAIGHDKKVQFLELARDLAAQSARQSNQRYAIALYGVTIYQNITLQTYSEFNQTINNLLNNANNLPNGGQTYLQPMLDHLNNELGSDVSSDNHVILLMGELSVIRDPPQKVKESAQKVALRNADIYVINEERKSFSTTIWDILTNNKPDHIINGTAYDDVGDLFSNIGPRLLSDFNNMNCET